MDIVSKQIRSRMMGAIRGKNTKPELQVRQYLHARGFRYRLHSRDVAGSPDLTLRKHNCVIFVHGCFWHRHRGCRYATTPSTRNEFWTQKLDANRARDIASHERLLNEGWRIAVVWECALRHLPQTTLEALREFLLSDERACELFATQESKTE